MSEALDDEMAGQGDGDVCGKWYLRECGQYRLIRDNLNSLSIREK